MYIKTLSYAVILSAAISALSVTAHAQGCHFAPADCPVNGTEDAGTPDDSTQRLLNPVIPREIAMENRLRRWTADLVAKIAAKEGWDVVELSEDAGSGFRSPDDAVLSYPLRPPHWIEFHYQFIINKDSLKAWSDWLQDYSQRSMNALNDYKDKVNSQQDVMQAYMDSMNYYNQKKADYMTAHIAAYSKALTAQDKAGQAAYEKGNAVYDRKIDEFTKKMAAIQNPAGTQAASDNRDAERARQTLRWHDASVIVVEFAFNSEYAKTVGTITGGGTITTGGAASAKAVWFKNSEPDLVDIDVFRRSRSMALQLFGGWKRTPDGEGYTPIYNTDKTSTDHTTPKKIKSDQVRTIFCRVSGNAPAIRRWLSDINTSEFESLLAKDPG